jgi:hypothetical protein
MATFKRHTVCGVPVRLGRPKRQVLAGGLVAPISKAEAKRLLQTLFGRTTLPRPGHQTRLCGDQWLDNTSGRFAVDRRRDSSGFEGVKPRRNDAEFLRRLDRAGLRRALTVLRYQDAHPREPNPAAAQYDRLATTAGVRAEYRRRGWRLPGKR